MAHVKEQIRDAVGALLAASPTNWSAVYKTRVVPQREVYPRVLVWVGNESVEPMDIHTGFLQQREITVEVRAHYRNLEDGQDMEDALDNISAEIETTLTHAELITTLPKVSAFFLASSNTDLVEGENQRTYIELQQEWIVRCHTIEGAPETFV